MPTARSLLAAGVVGSKVYAIGGTPGTLTTVEEYDPATNQWTTKASMTTARYGLAVSVVNNKIYAIGGSSGTTVEEYDPATNTWTNCGTPAPGNGCTPMPTGREGLAIGVVGSKIYAIGGTTGPSPFATVEEYDPATNTWTTKTSMPTGRYYLAVGVVGSKIYAIGGYSGGYLTTVEEYDPATNTWTNCGTPAPGNGCTPMPTARTGLAVGVVNNKIYAIGGLNSSGNLTTVEEYDPATNTWTTKTSMQTGRYYLAAGVVNNKMYAIGGYNGSSYFTTVEEGTVE
jgi:N-acetylneuraminic acid mutarotase